MTKKQILEGNKLIAKFMGLIPIKYKLNGEKGNSFITKEDNINYEGFEKFFCMKDAKYYSSWNWLIPACKKWDEMIFPNDNIKLLMEYLQRCDSLDNKVSCYEILPVFEQLVDNIKWYNGLDTGK